LKVALLFAAKVFTDEKLGFTPTGIRLFPRMKGFLSSSEEEEEEEDTDGVGIGEFSDVFVVGVFFITNTYTKIEIKVNTAITAPNKIVQCISYVTL
jgi:hypothetical protein